MRWGQWLWGQTLNALRGCRIELPLFFISWAQACLSSDSPMVIGPWVSWGGREWTWRQRPFHRWCLRFRGSPSPSRFYPTRASAILTHLSPHSESRLKALLWAWELSPSPPWSQLVLLQGGSNWHKDESKIGIKVSVLVEFETFTTGVWTNGLIP